MGLAVVAGLAVTMRDIYYMIRGFIMDLVQHPIFVGSVIVAVMLIVLQVAN